jgi:hypothetical protein
MVTARRAFRAGSTLSTIAAILREDVPPASEVAPDVPAELDRVITRCLRKDPARRFQHMEDLRVALDELREESSSSCRSIAASRPRRRSRWTVALLILAAGAGGALYRFWPFQAAPAALALAALTTSPGVESAASFRTVLTHLPNAVCTRKAPHRGLNRSASARD